MQQLWDYIADEADSAELTALQKAELVRRREAYREAPTELYSWSDVKRSLREDE